MLVRESEIEMPTIKYKFFQPFLNCTFMNTVFLFIIDFHQRLYTFKWINSHPALPTRT